MIHKSSVIDPKATIEKNVKIGPFCFVGENEALRFPLTEPVLLLIFLNGKLI